MRNRFTRGAAALIAAAAMVAFPLTAGADAPPITKGAAWLVGHVRSGGYVTTSGTTPDLGSTTQVALAVHEATGPGMTNKEKSMLTYLAAHENTYIDGTLAPSATNDSAGSLANLILLAHATGSDAQLGASTLVTRLEATQSTKAPGLFGSSDPTYDGTIRQSLALEALRVSKVSLSSSVMTTGATWLEDQQCTNGGFSADAAATGSTGCAPSQYAGPDSNSTGYALVALATVGKAHSAPVTAALNFLAGMERNHGGFGYLPGNAADSNSTADVLMGLRAVGQSPGSTHSRWAKGGSSVTASLLHFQVSAGSDRGGFRFQLSSTTPKPDVISSEQAVLALSGWLPTT